MGELDLIRRGFNTPHCRRSMSLHKKIPRPPQEPRLLRQVQVDCGTPRRCGQITTLLTRTDSTIRLRLLAGVTIAERLRFCGHIVRAVHCDRQSWRHPASAWRGGPNKGLRLKGQGGLSGVHGSVILFLGRFPIGVLHRLQHDDCRDQADEQGEDYPPSRHHDPVSNALISALRGIGINCRHGRRANRLHGFSTCRRVVFALRCVVLRPQ
jgi:hypothetical protein